MKAARPVYVLEGSGGLAAPLVLDSPHSGTHFPEDIALIAPMAQIRQTEDVFVDTLFSGAIIAGVPLLKATFSRSFIDVNRAVDDIDPTILCGAFPTALHPSERSIVGHGLIRHLCRGQMIYGEKIPVAVALSRIENYYKPYHGVLQALISTAHQRYGAVWHINCHSMSASDNQGLARISEMFSHPRADIVLGDRNGTACEPAFLRVVAQFFKSHGYSVAVNDPYKGMEILQRHGQPHKGRHSLQLEINRRLYVNEESFERLPGFARLQTDLTELVTMLKEWTLLRTQKAAAE